MKSGISAVYNKTQKREWLAYSEMKGQYTKLFDNIFCFTKQKYSLYEREQQIEYVSWMSRELNKATRH